MPSAPGAGGLSEARVTSARTRPLYRMQARSRGAPVVLAVPREPLAKRFGDAPSVRVTEPGEHGPRRCRAERLDELLPEEPERDGIEQEHAFASESDASALGN